MPHHETPSEADCDICGRLVNPVTRHNFHPQTGQVTCDTCLNHPHSYPKLRKDDWE